MKKRDLWAAALLMALALILGLGLFRGRAVETGSWGLSLRTEGTAPVGNASPKALAEYGGAYLGFTYLSGWMISGGRYMLSCVPLFVLLGKMKPGTGKRFLFLIFSFLFFAYSLFYLHGFAIM